MKPLLVIQTRFVNRPLHKEFIKSLTEVSWADTRADFAVAFHGDAKEVTEDFDLWDNNANHVGAWDAATINHIGKTNGYLAPLEKLLFEDGAVRAYEFVCMLDDDAWYPEPYRMTIDVLTAFDTDAKCAVVGPMGSFRKFRRFENKPAFMEPLARQPWTTLGSQVYRMEAIRQVQSIGMLDVLDEIEFRVDSFLYLLLYMLGWNLYEMDIPFRHRLSSAINAKQLDPYKFHMGQVARGKREYNIFREKLHFVVDAFPTKNSVYDLGDDLPSIRPNCTHMWLDREIDKLERATTNHHTARAEKAYARL